MAYAIINGEASEVLLASEPNQFDLAVFSPPYDGLRDYQGYQLDLHQVGRGLHHIIKPGGVVAMVIQDQTIKGAKSLTTFRTIVDWCDKIGFHLWECLIYHREGRAGVAFDKRFRIDHEYIPLFVKGVKPSYFDKDKDTLKVPCKYAGRRNSQTRSFRNQDGTTRIVPQTIIPEEKCIGTIWYLPNASRDQLKKQHPGTFPDQIPYKLIEAFTPPDGYVLDPMVGSGSTGVAADLLGRDFIGIDISAEYCQLAERRIKYHRVHTPNYHREATNGRRP